MKILWTHNFNPEIQNSGVFMNIFANAMRKIGVQIDTHYLGSLNNPKNFLKSRLEVFDISGEYDLVHAQFGSACAIVSASARCPKILSLRGSDWYRYNYKSTFIPSIHSYLACAMSRFSMSEYDSVLVMSNRMRAELLLEKPSTTVDVLIDPIDLMQFFPIEKNIARKNFGAINDNSKWILFTTLSERNPIKRLDLARKAVEIVNKKFGPVELKVATGIQHDQMPYFVSCCDVALTTSVHEGWPNCIKEALACNIPFVATDVSDLAEISKRESSCRVCSDDPFEIADGIINALTSPKSNLRQYVQGMDIQIASGKLLKLYENLIHNN